MFNVLGGDFSVVVFFQTLRSILAVSVFDMILFHYFFIRQSFMYCVFTAV